MTAVEGLDLLLALLARADTLGSLLRTAQSEGRDITADELDGLAASDDEARAALDAAIAKAKKG